MLTNSRGQNSGSLVVRRLPKVQSDYQLGPSGGLADYHKIWECFHICKSIFNNGLPDISVDYQIIQPGRTRTKRIYSLTWCYINIHLLTYISIAVWLYGWFTCSHNRTHLTISRKCPPAYCIQDSAMNMRSISFVPWKITWHLRKRSLKIDF